MADIFISYSSKDRQQAEQLTELLASAGLSVWIDKHGIGAATSWTSEIAAALDECKVFILLLSPNSLASKNVIKELTLAAEADKHIIPVDLEMVTIPTAFKYHLAGLQRTPIEDTDAIIVALARMGCDCTPGVTPHFPALASRKTESDTIGLAILPFEDLSPAHDNEWFADGMMDELIGTLGAIEKLHVAARSDVIYYKKTRPKAAEIAHELNIRYIVEGSVQKSGEKIRLRISLSDAQQHKQIWSGKYDGMFNDIFDFQDQTATSITEALRLVLTPHEEKEIEKRPTENADAYELYLRGLAYYERHTRADYEHALKLYRDALGFDPSFALAHIETANVSYALFRRHSRDPKLLTVAEEHLAKIETIEGQTARVLAMRSLIAIGKGNGEEAVRLAESATMLDAECASAFDALAIANYALDHWSESITAREQYLALQPADRNAIINYLTGLFLFDKEKAQRKSADSIPLFERHVRFVPDDFNARAQFATVLAIADEQERSMAEAEFVSTNWEHADGIALFSIANLYMVGGFTERVIPTLRKCVERGYRNVDSLRRSAGPIATLRGTPEFEALVKELEDKIEKEQHG